MTRSATVGGMRHDPSEAMCSDWALPSMRRVSTRLASSRNFVGRNRTNMGESKTACELEPRMMCEAASALGKVTPPRYIRGAERTSKGNDPVAEGHNTSAGPQTKRSGAAGPQDGSGAVLVWRTAAKERQRVLASNDNV